MKDSMRNNSEIYKYTAALSLLSTCVISSHGSDGPFTTWRFRSLLILGYWSYENGRTFLPKLQPNYMFATLLQVPAIWLASSFCVYCYNPNTMSPQKLAKTLYAYT